LNIHCGKIKSENIELNNRLTDEEGRVKYLESLLEESRNHTISDFEIGDEVYFICNDFKIAKGKINSITYEVKQDTSYIFYNITGCINKVPKDKLFRTIDDVLNALKENIIDITNEYTSKYSIQKI
jgi:hypothetical protein